MIIHVVKQGESIYTIANEYGVSWQKIVSDNELANPNQLVVGQTIVILQGPRQYTVKSGDTLYSIALQNQIRVSEILRANPQITNPTALTVGQVITIPEGGPKFGSIQVNGYAFPNIKMDTLRKTLPYLTYLSIFSYHARADGSLEPLDDVPLIQAARAARVAPLLVMSNIGQSGSFDSDLASAILNNPSVQDTLINNVISTMRQKNYYGLDIDFEYIYPKDREAYNNFLRKVVNRLHPLGYQVTTALAPKTSADQPGKLYEAHDYPVHGELADHVILMTYEWGFTYSPPQAVAPVNLVRKVLNYAVTAIPRRKIFMGIPNYGYDWTLPYREGTAAQSISNVGAVNQALRVGAAIQYDPVAQSPFYRYYENGVQHEVWFEDARSILAKLALANEFRVGGVSYWPIMQYFPQNWLVLSSVYNITKVL